MPQLTFEEAQALSSLYPEGVDLDAHVPLYAERHSTTKEKPTLKSLQLRHREIIRLIAVGCRHKYIAERLGISLSTVSNIANDPLSKAEIRRLSRERDMSAGDLRQTINEIADKALVLMDEVIEDKSQLTRDRLAAGKTILSIAVPTVNVNVSAPLGGGLLEEIKALAFPEEVPLETEIEKGDSGEATEAVS